jgi:hypothetical protein
MHSPDINPVRRCIRLVFISIFLLVLTACSGGNLPINPTIFSGPSVTYPNTSTNFQPDTASPLIPTGSSASTEPPALDITEEILTTQPTDIVSIPSPTLESPAGTVTSPIFDTFVNSVKNGRSDQVTGVYVENRLSLRVVQQPANDAAFVATIDGTATQFLMAFQVAGNIGLLAHNYLAGRLFFDLQTGDIVQLIYGDGNVSEFEITTIYQYQALNPSSPYSNFLDIQNGETLSANDLFYRVYGGDFHLTFQTCIAQDNNDSWGRMFVIALPL